MTNEDAARLVAEVRYRKCQPGTDQDEALRLAVEALEIMEGLARLERRIMAWAESSRTRHPKEG